MVSLPKILVAVLRISLYPVLKKTWSQDLHHRVRRACVREDNCVRLDLLSIGED